MDKITEASLLYDFYGQLLTERKRQVMALYHEEDLSLAEIAQEFGISRAAVYDSLKSAERTLRDYEEKLGLVQRSQETGAALRRAAAMLDALSERYAQEPALVRQLAEIRQVIGDLEEA